MPSFMPDYIITEATSLPNQHCADEEHWEATIRVNIYNKEDAYEWLTNYENESSCDFRVTKCRKVDNSKRLVFKKVYHCHHDTKPKGSSQLEGDGSRKKSKNWKTKHTACKSLIRFTIKEKSMSWRTDYLLQECPCEIFIRHQHNHRIKCADAQRLRRPSKEVKEKFLKLFAHGHSPISAIETHKFDLMMEKGDLYTFIAADSSKCPSNYWVYKLFKKVAFGHYGPQSGEGVIEKLREYALKYNEEVGDQCIKIELLNGKDLIIAICTPIMKRTHKLLRSAGEMIFVDSSGNMDVLNCRVFPLMTHSVAGALPLGILIVSSEAEEVLKPGLEVLKSILPPKAFFGRGPDVGPKIAMTDDCTGERNSLKSAFPGIVLLLCLFHILQAFWRYIWKRDHNVAEKHRPEVFYQFRELVYAPDKDSFDQRVKDAMENPLLLAYNKVLDHIQKYLARSKEWALFEREDLLTRGNNTNNYAEAVMRLIKDKVLGRTKAFNPVQLVDFLVTRFTVYIEMRICDVLNNRSLNPFRSRYFIRPEKLEKLSSEKLPSPPDCYKVVNTIKGTSYIVMMSHEICSCPEGKSGKPCKHLCKVVKDFNLSSSLLLPREQIGEETKMMLFEIMCGHRNVPSGWFQTLRQCSSPPTATAQADDSSGDPPDCLDIPDSSSGLASHYSDNGGTDDETSTSVLSAEENLNKIFAGWIDCLKKRPDIFLKPCQTMIETCQKMNNSDSALVSAMVMFGKQSANNKPLCVKNFNQSTIGVLSTNRVRRTVHLEGQQAQQGGRPPNAMFRPSTEEHGYTQTTGLKRKSSEPAHWAHIPSKRALPAPHALQVCVNANRMIGQNHSKK